MGFEIITYVYEGVQRMRAYNLRTEQEKGDQLRGHLKKMADWYRKQYLDFNQVFQSELNMELADKQIYFMTKDYGSFLF